MAENQTEILSELTIQPTPVSQAKESSETFITHPITVTSAPSVTSTKMGVESEETQSTISTQLTTRVRNDGFLVFGAYKTTTQMPKTGSDSSTKQNEAGFHVSWIILAVLLATGSGISCVIAVICSLLCLDRLAWLEARFKVRETFCSISTPSFC
jgi:hypothetical protein